MFLLFSALLGYLCGSVSTGLLLARFSGDDLRGSGSGNIGATNVARVLGRKAGLITLIGDMAKVWLALLIVYLLNGGFLSLVIAGSCAVAGHIFPLYYGFKGGKGVASGLALYFVVAPLAAAAVALLFVVLVKTTRYVSLASVVGAALLPFILLFFYNSTPLTLSSFCICSLIIWKHRENIRRLREGSENRL